MFLKCKSCLTTAWMQVGDTILNEISHAQEETNNVILFYYLSSQLLKQDLMDTTFFKSTSLYLPRARI